MIGPDNGAALGVPLGDGVGVGVGRGVAVGVAVGVGVGRGVAVGVAVGVGVGRGVAVGVFVGLGVAVGVGDGEIVGTGVGEWPASGMTMIELTVLPPPLHAASASAIVTANSDDAMRNVPHRIAIKLPSARPAHGDIGARHTSSRDHKGLRRIM